VIVQPSSGGVLIPAELCAAIGRIARAGLREVEPRDGLRASLPVDQLRAEMDAVLAGWAPGDGRPPPVGTYAILKGKVRSWTKRGMVMRQLQVTSRFPSIAKEDLAEFKRVASELTEATANEPGTLQYAWFFNADETECVALEMYTDSNAVMAHLGAVAELLRRIVQLGGRPKLDIFGHPSAELRQRLDGAQPTIHSHFQSK
jgi:quinol monooxygenase YgiN